MLSSAGPGGGDWPLTTWPCSCPFSLCGAQLLLLWAPWRPGPEPWAWCAQSRAGQLQGAGPRLVDEPTLSSKGSPLSERSMCRPAPCFCHFRAMWLWAGYSGPLGLRSPWQQGAGERTATDCSARSLGEALPHLWLCPRHPFPLPGAEMCRLFWDMGPNLPGFPTTREISNLWRGRRGTWLWPKRCWWTTWRS